jgi:lipid II:glycine glycyltransferase (peptidoglycan interpeptide bridge formation enzyme)
VDWGEGGTLPLLVIRRRLGLGVSFAYVPWGPELPGNFPSEDTARNRALVELAQNLQALLPWDTAFIRFDPPWYSEGPDTAPPSIYKPFSRAGADIQAPDTVLIDLTATEKAILMQMKSKWRYNIGLGEKRGVTVRQTGEEGLVFFYNLLKDTAKRDGIAIHDFEYYKTLFSHSQDFPQGGQELWVYLAEYEGEVLAAIIVLFRGKSGVYLYGASSDHQRQLMAPYSLQWKAMQDAKAKGCIVYDLFGISPTDDPTHPMAGLYRFKTGFGGRIIHRPGSWDYAYHPLMRNLFITLESFRKKLRNLKKKRIDKP